MTTPMVMTADPSAPGAPFVPAGLTPDRLRTGVSFMPQMGQLPGWFWMTWGSMPQV